MKLEIDPERFNEIRQSLRISQTGWYNPEQSTDRGEAL